MLCRKCGTKQSWANGLCRNCHNQFYYAKKTHGLTLKEFVQSKEKKTYYKTGGIKFDKFLKEYDEKSDLSMTDLAKKIGVSRETLYKYIRQYNKEKKEI